MKHRHFLAYILVVTFCLLAGCKEKPLAGGFGEASVTDEKVIAAADFAIKAQERSMQDPEAGQTTTLELVKILSAAQQVVAGMNYRLTLEVKVNGEKKQADAIVWWQSWRDPDPYQLTSWRWSDQ